MRIFHLALASDWQAAVRDGRYTTSTLGRTLAEEGFIHASRGDQWQQVRTRFYADVTEPLVLLVIDTERLSAPVVEEPPTGGAAAPGEETFPHVYGAIETSAVVEALSLDPLAGAAPATGATAPAGRSFSAVFLAEVFHRVLLASIVATTVLLGAAAGLALRSGSGAVVGTLLGLVVGVLLARVVHRRREAGQPG